MIGFSKDMKKSSIIPQPCTIVSFHCQSVRDDRGVRLPSVIAWNFLISPHHFKSQGSRYA